MIQIRSIFMFVMINMAIFLVACGTAGPVKINTEQETASQSESDTVTEADDIAADTGNGQDNIEPVDVSNSNESDSAKEVAVTAVEIDEESTEFDGDIQVGFTADGHAYRGDPDAPVVIEEFSDFQCPYCARFTAQTMPIINDNQIANGEAMLIYYDFPLESIHLQAFAAANAARCAGEDGAIAYWDMHDLLYQRVEEWSVDDPNPVFTQLAEELSLNIDAFSECVGGMRYQEAIEADISLATEKGVRSTPSFFLNGESLIGAQPINVFNQAIEMVRGGETLATETEESDLEMVLEPPRMAPTPAAIESEDAAVRIGDADAPVTIVEFTDYQCPFCQRYAQETLPFILSNMVEAGQVQYIIKDLPLESIHPEARTAAEVARCAGDQDVYWPMHDIIFENQQAWSGQGDAALEILVGLADSLGIDQDALRTCVEEGRYADAVQQNIDEAISLGANATPYFFIDGLPIPGAQPYDLFVYAVGLAEEGLLAAAYESGEPDISNSHAIGDPDAPVVIIEYTDFQCPFCSRHYQQTFGQIKEQYVDKGLVYYVFKDFPLTNIHPQAVKAAEAARCAGDQDAYPEMHGKLFSSQSEWSGNSNASEIFIDYAGDLGLDIDKFAGCLESGQYESAVLQDLDEGSQLGVSGTPSFFINGHTMSGAQPFQLFQQAINQVMPEK